MTYDQYGQTWTTCNEIVDMLYHDPDLDFENFLLQFGGGSDSHDITKYRNAVKEFYLDFPELRTQREIDVTVDEFDRIQQSIWHMPEEYLNMDIAAWILDQCKTQDELQRVGKELLLYQERNLFDLLRQLKYVVDTWRANDIVWGVGRGSSVASYVLYLMGVHRINSMYYDLDVEEFLR